ncbi:MAG: tetratricopeptide repeat protein [Acidobacteriota bacterium]|nr:tetratricopeptide repeat protein [Acidobacteriota bacterium]
MKRCVPLVCLVVMSGGLISAQTVDLPGSYYHFSVARMHELNGEYRDAISEFEQAITLNPESASLRVEFAETLWKAGRTRRAVETCQLASELDPQSSAPHFLLGRIYSNFGTDGQNTMTTQAIEEFRQAIALDPDHFAALYDLGRLLLTQEQYRETLQVTDRFINLRPWIVQGYELKAKAHTQLGETQLAIETLEKSLDYDNTYVENIRFLGELYERTNQYVKAQELYSRALTDITDPDMQYRLAILLIDQNRPSEAASLLRELSQQYPSNMQIYMALGRALKNHKHYAEAAEIFLEVLENDPKNYGINYQLAEVENLLGKRQEAIDRFLRLRELSDSHAQINSIDTSLALIYQRARQFDEAIEIFRRIMAENPDDLFTTIRLVYALKDANQLAEALRLSEKLFEQNASQSYEEEPNKIYLLIARAQVLSAADQLEQSAHLLNEGIQKHHDPQELYLASSQLYVDHKRYLEAEDIIKEAIVHYPENERMQFQLGAIYERQKEWVEVESVFERILENNPQHPGVLNYLGYMLADRGIRLSQALTYIIEAVKIEPHNGAYLDSLGWVYFKLKNYDQAEVNLLEASRLVDSDATIFGHLGDLYDVLGQHEKAQDYYEKSILFAEDPDEREKVQKKLSDVEHRIARKKSLEKSVRVTPK